MAELHQLSSNLTSFKNVYDNSFSTMKTKQSDLSNTINEAINAIDSAIDGFSAAGSDNPTMNVKSCLTLAKDGSQRLKSHIDGDLTALFADGDEVRGDDSGKEIIGAIVKLINDGKDWKGSWWEKIWNAIKEVFTDEYIENDQAKIDRANEKIDHLNKKGDAQLTAMSNAINGATFGIAGNMNNNGSLGNSVTYEDLYNFNAEQWEQENPEYHLNIAQQLGCTVVGAVEGVAHIAESIVDVGATAVGWVVSFVSPSAAESISNFVATDWTAKGAAALMDATSGVFGISGDAYLASGGRSFGRTAGTVVGNGALWLTGGGAILSAASMAGSNMESNLQNGASLGKALGTGAVVGVGSYFLGKAGQALATKFAGWATGAGSGNFVGKVYNAVSKAATTSVFKAQGFGGKIASFVMTPVRWAGKAMQTGANLLGRTGLSNSVIGRADAAVTRGFNKLFHVGGAAPAPTNNNGENNAQPNPAGDSPSSDPLATDVDPDTLSRGSMTADGRYHPPANQNGAPTGPGDSAFNDLPVTTNDIGMYARGNSTMTYSQAQHNLKMIDELGLLNDPTSADYEHAVALWQESMATVADTLYGQSGVSLVTGGNWYSTAQNTARFLGQEGINNLPGAWEGYTEQIYGQLGRLDT